MSVISDIKQAGKEKKLLKITYRKSSGEVSERVVEPYEIRSDGKFWGWDTEKDEIRQFFIVNILSTEILDEEYSPRWDVKM